jgi:uncharacterized protein (TIGR03066 family)
MKKQTALIASLVSLIALPAFAADCYKQLPGTWEYVVERSKEGADTMGRLEYKPDGTMVATISKYNITATGTYNVQDQKIKTVFGKQERTFVITDCTPDTMTNKRDDGKVEQFKRIK